MSGMRERVRDFAQLNAGALLVAAGVYFFKFPNRFSTGGVSGISILLGEMVPGLSTGSFVMIVNLLLLGLGFAFVNGRFGARTVYASLLFSGAIWVLERVYPMAAPMTGQPFLELIFSVLLPAAGSALLFNIGASTGGTDITAMILKKYTSMDIGRALLLCDFGITLSACFVFGMETGLFSMLGLILKAFLVDGIVESVNMSKYFHIVTECPQPLEEYITRTLGRSCTVLPCTGAYTGAPRTLLLSAMNRAQAVRLNRYIKSNDPGAFVTITNTSSIIGKGFRSPM